MKKSKMVSNCCGAEVESVIQSGPLNSPPPAWTVCSKCKQYCGLVDDAAKEPKFTTESLDILGPLPSEEVQQELMEKTLVDFKEQLRHHLEVHPCLTTGEEKELREQIDQLEYELEPGNDCPGIDAHFLNQQARG